MGHPEDRCPHFGKQLWLVTPSVSDTLTDQIPDKNKIIDVCLLYYLHLFSYYHDYACLFIISVALNQSETVLPFVISS